MRIVQRVSILLAAPVLAAACGTAAASPAASTASTATPALTASPMATIAPTPTAAPTATRRPGPADWPTYQRDAARSGNNSDFPALHGPLRKAWTADLDGAVYAEPLVVNGRVLVATENDSVYSLDPETGAVVWSRNLGTPVPLDTLPCGGIDPLGITSTPAFDAVSGSLFVVAEMTGPRHVMFALDPESGDVRWSRNVDLPGDDPKTHQQRASLVVANGYVYFGYGGLSGDCGQYTGKVVGVPVTGRGDTIVYRVPTARMGAIWSPGGPAVDEAGYLYVATGNGASMSTFDHSNSVVKLTPDLQEVSYFAPSRWIEDNRIDKDLGSSTPALVPGGYVFIVGKSGIGYVLRQDGLGGIGGQVSEKTVCASAYGGIARDGNNLYIGCHASIRRVRISAAGAITLGWQSRLAGWPPVVGGGSVWAVSTRGVLAQLDASTGATQATISLGEVPHFTTPTLWNGLVFIGKMNGVVAVKGS
jgi:outer membrane protein assembly factor BamB